jgi:cysteine synthase A
MPEGYSAEFQHSAKLYGARLLLTEPSSGMDGALLKAEEVVASDPNRYVLLNQFKNPANPAIHFKTTGPEIWDQTDGKIDVLVAGIGTGGTITGATRYIKQTQGKGIISIGVEPAASPTITQIINKQPVTGRAHGIRGLGAGFIPETLDLTLVDHIELVTDDEALDTCRRLGREEGITAGISSGAVVAVAVRIGKRPEFNGKTIVVVLPDTGERYLNTVSAASQRTALPDHYGAHGAGI